MRLLASVANLERQHNSYGSAVWNMQIRAVKPRTVTQDENRILPDIPKPWTFRRTEPERSKTEKLSAIRLTAAPYVSYSIRLSAITIPALRAGRRRLFSGGNQHSGTAPFFVKRGIVFEEMLGLVVNKVKG